MKVCQPPSTCSSYIYFIPLSYAGKAGTCLCLDAPQRRGRLRHAQWHPRAMRELHHQYTHYKGQSRHDSMPSTYRTEGLPL